MAGMFDRRPSCGEFEFNASATSSSNSPADQTSIALRPLAHSHLDLTRAWANEPELMRLMDRGSFVGEDEHVAWFAALPNQSDRRYYAIELGDERCHVGNVWLWQIDERHAKAEVRIVVGKTAAQGAGLGTRALEAVTEIAFHELGLTRLYAYTLGFNPRARRAFEKAGFVVEGVLKNDRRTASGFCDVYLLGRNHLSRGRV